MYPLYISFFNFIQFHFQINDSSEIVIQNNRHFGQGNETNQKVRCVMHTRSYRISISHLKRTECANRFEILKRLMEIVQGKTKK